MSRWWLGKAWEMGLGGGGNQHGAGESESGAFGLDSSIWRSLRAINNERIENGTPGSTNIQSVIKARKA